MKSYPSISPQIITEFPIYAFDKLDGSNIRAEWSRKKKFYKFGSKNRLVDHYDPILGKSPELVKVKYEEDLSNIFKKQRFERVICFFEFWGETSFAGNHNEAEEKTVTLFDVNPYKKGIMFPKEYLKLFGHLDIAKLLYNGNANRDFQDQVINGTLEGMTFEGVVCKAKHPSSKMALPVMFKIKNKVWIEKLRDFCSGNNELFERLL